MKKIIKGFLIIIAAAMVLFVSASTTLIAFADTEEPPVDVVMDDVPPADNAEDNLLDETDEGLATVAQRFKDYLKELYGADYDYYYNQIIEHWGSVEAYLLSFGEKLPEEYKTSWDEFVGWLREYSVVWAPALAIAILVIIAILGKKVYKKIKDWFAALVEKLVNAKLNPVVHELNLQSSAMAATMNAQRALLGNNEKFANNVKELEKCERELKNE